MKEYVLDFVETFSNEELAKMIREGIVTIGEVEWALRRRLKI